MSNYVWTSDYSVGNLILDQHHQNLVQLFNNAYEVLTQMRPSTETNKILSELTTYSIFHFSEEEKLMRAAAYDEIESHMLEHKEFIRKIQEFKAQFNDKTEDLNEEIFLFLYEWLITHIIKSDKKYEDALKSIKK